MAEFTPEDAALCREAAQVMAYVAADMMSDSHLDTGPITPEKSGEAGMLRLAEKIETFLGLTAPVEASGPYDREP